MKALLCSSVRQDLPLYLEGEMDPLRTLQTASHLSSCGECTEEARIGGKVLSSLRDLQEPKPPRDITGNVLNALRALRSSLSPGAALKWSSLGLVMAIILWPALHPRATFDLGVRIVSRLGELLNLEAIVSGFLGLIPAIIPSLTGLFDMIREGVPAPGSAPSAALLVIMPLILLAAAVVFTCLSGGLVLSAVRSSRMTAGFRKSRSSCSFDNPPGLP